MQDVRQAAAAVVEAASAGATVIRPEVHATWHHVQLFCKRTRTSFHSPAHGVCHGTCMTCIVHDTSTTTHCVLTTVSGEVDVDDVLIGVEQAVSVLLVDAYHVTRP